MDDASGASAARIYKICPREAWAKALSDDLYTGSPDDLCDGFIHLSTAEQVAGTLARHFPGQADLVLIALDADQLGAALKWEPSRGGALYPHLYAPLAPSLARAVTPLALDAGGRHVLPPEVA